MRSFTFQADGYVIDTDMLVPSKLQFGSKLELTPLNLIHSFLPTDVVRPKLPDELTGTPPQHVPENRVEEDCIANN